MTPHVCRLIATLAVTASAIALASACSEEEIVLATVPSSEGGTNEQLKRCVQNTDCSATTFCARHDCHDVGGTCQPRPVVCEEGAMPVCGCDGITYWNDCLRRAAGATSMRPGECGETGRPCGRGMRGGPPPPPGAPDPDICPPGASCARLLPPSVDISMCPPDLGGTCWALPAVCPEQGGAGPDRWIPCDPQKTFCASTCEAIRTGQPHRRAISCP